MRAEHEVQTSDSAAVEGRRDPVVVRTRRGEVECAVAGDGPAVLCLHGAMGGHDQALLLARTIGAAGFRYVAPSRPGYLGTSLALGRTPDEQADLYRDLLDALGIDRVAVMAISGGGPSALAFALRHPDRCWGLVIVSSVCRRVENRLPLAWWLLRVAARFPSFAAAIGRKADADPDASTRRSIRDPAVRERTLRDPEAGPLLRELQASTRDRMRLRMPGTENDVAVTRREHAFALERIVAPTLVVHGTIDTAAPFAQGEEMASRIPGAELVAIDGGEHVAIFTHRALVRARVAGFLAAHAPARPETGR
ncbi:MAG TPA: alpha/beta hydrolase [Anaeromyxobacteraceae bacterium]|nr:alpha/beta hydrolase [Anaeromyxobacteraceae bacterium]